MNLKTIALVSVAAAVFAAPAYAHHSYAMFDHDLDLHVTGTVKNFLWTNPHSWLDITVTDATGTHPFGFETRNPGVLARIGLTPTSFKPGDKVTITYHPLKDGSHGGEITQMTLADGRHISISVAGVSAGETPHY